MKPQGPPGPPGEPVSRPSVNLLLTKQAWRFCVGVLSFLSPSLVVHSMVYLLILSV